MYLVWSNEHQAWWRSNKMGYTMFLNSAGRYSRDEAMEICKDALVGRREQLIPEVMVLEKDAMEFLGGTQS